MCTNILVKDAVNSLKDGLNHLKLTPKNTVRGNVTRSHVGSRLRKYALSVIRVLLSDPETSQGSIAQTLASIRRKYETLLRRAPSARRSLPVRGSTKRRIAPLNAFMTTLMGLRGMIAGLVTHGFMLRVKEMFGSIGLLWRNILAENSNLGNRYTMSTGIRETTDRKTLYSFFQKNITSIPLWKEGLVC